MQIPDKHPVPQLSGQQPDGGHRQPDKPESASKPQNPAAAKRVHQLEREASTDEVGASGPAGSERRTDRVMQLRRQLAEGTYQVKGQHIAVNMIDETMQNNTILTHIDTKA